VLLPVLALALVKKNLTWEQKLVTDRFGPNSLPIDAVVWSTENE